MNVAKHDAARKGYELFRSVEGHTTMETINAELSSAGRPPIADRTFRHYKRLAARGQRSYIPINEFDMAIKARRLSDN